MNIKKYNYNYGMYDAEVHFDVDLDIFTEEMAKGTLDFFSWDDEPDLNENAVDEVMKKYAMRAIMAGAFNDMSVCGIKNEFQEMEGYCPVDGSYGITLTYFYGHSYESDNLTLLKDEE